MAATFSPDGRWVAYHQTNVARVNAVFVQPFPATGAKYFMGSGIHPVWSRDGRQLFWGSGPGQFGVVNVTTTPSFSFGNLTALPRPFLSSGTSFERPFDMMPDGQHVVALVSPGVGSSGTLPEIRVVLNWFEDVKQRVPNK